MASSFCNQFLRKQAKRVSFAHPSAALNGHYRVGLFSPSLTGSRTGFNVRVGAARSVRITSSNAPQKTTRNCSTFTLRKLNSGGGGSTARDSGLPESFFPADGLQTRASIGLQRIGTAKITVPPLRQPAKPAPLLAYGGFWHFRRPRIPTQELFRLFDCETGGQP